MTSTNKWGSTFTIVKGIFLAGSILWVLSSLNSIDKETEQMKDAYLGFKISNQEVSESLDSTNKSLSLQNNILKSNQDEVLKSLNDQQAQVDGLIKFLMKTQPDHKATLQSFTGSVLTE